MSSDLGFHMTYCPGDIPSGSFYLIIVYLFKNLLCIFAFMSNIITGRSLWVRKSLVYLCIRRSSTFLYLFGYEPVNQGGLNVLRPILSISGSSASVFFIAGVMSRGLEVVVSWIRLAFMMYCSSERVSALLGREPVMDTILGENYLCLLIVWVFSVPCL